MSTNTNKTTIDIELDGTEIVPTYPTDITVTNDQCVEIENPESIIEGFKKEYSIVGDGLYASLSTDQAPEWLTSIIDDVVDSAVDRGLTNYDDLVQDVRDAIDSIDTAKNTYVEQVSIDAIVDGIVVSRLAQLNATVGSNSSTITDLDFAVSTLNSTFAQRVVDIVSDYDDTTNARITQVNNTLANADTAIANSVTALSSRLNDQESDLEGTADAVSGLQTYVGLTDFNYPNGTGMLSRLNIIEKQNDGVIEYTVSTVDPMSGVDPDDITPDNNQLLTDLEPYVSWASEDATLETEETRAAHIGDVYIVYADDSNGVRTYVKSYKFIKTAVDEDSPFSTDTEGYTWALITDTDAQSAYVIALNAQDLADSKRRVFTQEPFAPYDIGDLWVDSSVSPQIVKTATVASTTGYLSAHWVQADQQAQDFITNTYTPDSNQIHRQLDGKIEYRFYESSTDLIDPETNEGALSESIALDVIAAPWTTQATRDNENGNVVYFKDTRNAYWYQASNNEWATIVDTSIYEALQDASAAQGAADGKVSQFYAFGDNEAPVDFTIPAVYQTDIYGNYLDEDGNVTQTESEYHEIRPEEIVSASSFTYWFDSTSTPELKHKNASDEWVAVPIGPDSLTAGISTFLAEGDLLTVVDKTTGDLSVYSFNGTSWQSSGPTGILSKSKWFVDLDNAVKNSDGKIAKAAADVIVTSEAYTNDQVTGAKSTFLYTTNLEVGGITYDAGFGLNADLSQLEEGETTAESEFWVDAGKFVLKNPLGGPDAVFTPTETGLTLGLEYTEATRNEPKGAYSASASYTKGDIVSYQGSSYTALQSVTGIAPDAEQVLDPLDEDYPYWQLLSSKGDKGVSGTNVDYWFKRASELPTDTPNTDGTDANSWYTDIGDTNLAASGDLYIIKGTRGEDSTTWSFGTPVINSKGIIREVRIYSDATTGTATVPTTSTYNFSTDTLTIGDSDWNASPPDLTANGQKIYAAVALVSGNATETSVAITWSGANVYAERQDGVNADAVTVTSDYNSETGVTTLSFNNGVSTTTATVTDGSEGTTKGVVPIFASSANDQENQSFTQGTLKYVNYYEYTNSKPTLPVADLTFVKYIGEDGDSEGVLPIYADDAEGANATFTFNNHSYVNFYEWTGTAPTTVPEDLTYVKFVGTDGINADVYKYAYKDSLNKPTSKPTDNAATGWVTSIPATINNTLWQSIGKQTAGAGDFVWSEVTQVTAKDGLSALLFDWTGSEGYNTNTDIDGADEWTFDSAFAGNAFIRINAQDAEGAINVAFNDVVLGTMSGPDNVTKWYEFAANNLVVGTNSLKIWSTTGDGGSTKAIKVAFSGAQGVQGIQGLTGQYTDFWFTRGVETPIVKGEENAPTWYTSVSSVPAGAGNLWSIKEVVTAGGASTSYSSPTVIQADIVRELVLYSGAVTAAVTKPTDTEVTYNFTSSSLTNGNTNWSETFPSGLADGKKVYRTTAIVAGNITETAKAVTGWSDPNVYAERKDGENGVSYTGTTEYYAKSSSGSTAPDRYSSETTINTEIWKTDPADAAVDSTNKYLWNFNRNTKSDGSFTDSTPFVLTQYVKDGKGISSITEAYQLHNSGTTVPTGTWSATIQSPTDTNPYLWNRTTIDYTEGSDTVIYTLIAVKGDSGTPADNYKEIFLYQNASSVPTSLPTNVQGFTAASGNSAATGNWTVTASAATAPAHTYRINLTVKQTNNAGDWAAVDSAWSGPVQLSAIDGNNASTYKEIFIYTNSTAAPSVPTTTAGYYSTTSGTVAIPVEDTTWTTAASAPSEGKFTWRSSLTLVNADSAGTWAASDTAWNGAVRLTGEVGPQGNSVKGDRGTAVLNYSADLGNTTPEGVTVANLESYWNSSASSVYDDEKAGDTLIVTNNNTSAGWTHIYEYDGTTWASSTAFTVNGNMVVEGTLSADAIGTGSLRTNGNMSSDTPNTSGGDTYTGVIIDNRGIRVYKDGVARIKIGDLS